MKRTIVFGLVGCGEIAVQTAKAISQSPNCEIGMVQDINEVMARDLAEKYSVPYCLTWPELLGNKHVDAVYVALPHHLHAPAAIEAAAAGKHVLVEKPIATTLADADRMIAAAETAGVSLSVAFTARYAQRTLKIKQVIDDGAIGSIVGLDFGSYGYKPPTYWSGGWTGRVETSWRTRKTESGGGVFLMNLVHTVDFVRFVTGLEVAAVAATYDTFKTNVEVEDYVVAILRYSNGAIGQARAATFVEGTVPGGAIEGDRIIGLSGQIFIARESIEMFLSKPYRDYEANKWHTISAESPWGGRQEFMTDFAKALLCGKTPPVTALDGRKALEVCLAVYKSGAAGQYVTLPLAQ